MLPCSSSYIPLKGAKITKEGVDSGVDKLLQLLDMMSQ